MDGIVYSGLFRAIQGEGDNACQADGNMGNESRGMPWFVSRNAGNAGNTGTRRSARCDRDLAWVTWHGALGMGHLVLDTVGIYLNWHLVEGVRPW